MVPLQKQTPLRQTPASEPSGRSEKAGPARRPSAFLPLAGKVIRALPSGLPTWVYTTLLKPPLLRRWTNALLLGMIPESVSINGVTIMLNPADPVVSTALTLGVYETVETQILTSRVRPGMHVLDIGANVGYFTALLAQAVGPTGSVTAFEPEPVNHAVLSKTIAANGFAHVHLVRGAVSEATGNSFLFLSELNQGDHRLYATAGRAKISVPNLSLDSFLLPDVPIDFIKMDIQGSEGRALRGMRATLRRNPQVQILTEFWPEGLTQSGVAPTEFLETLHGDLGFTLWEVDEKRGGLKPVKDFQDLIARHPGRCYTNLLCARSD